MVIAVIFWVVFGLVSAGIASSKGQPGCLWFVLGVMLGPIALIVALVIKDETLNGQSAAQVQAKPGELSAPGETKRCPLCAELIQAGAVYCRFCNHWLEHAYQQGIEAMRQSNWQLAVENFLKAIERAENTGEAYYGFALAQSKLGNRHEAVESLKSAASMGHEKAAKKLSADGIEF